MWNLDTILINIVRILYDILQEGRARGGEISKEKNFTDFMVHMTTNL